jgi:tetratricopeptide (TPR) repeat protein
MNQSTFVNANAQAPCVSDNTPSDMVQAPFDAPQATEVKEDFGNLVRRIMYSNSGKFHKIDSAPETKLEDARKVMPVGNADWTYYKNEAEALAAYGNAMQAEQMWLSAYQIAESFHAQDPRLAYTIENLASLYFALGDLERAEQFAQRAVAAYEAIYGPCHVRVANALNSLSGVYYSRGHYLDAEPVCVRALTIYNKCYGSEHADVGMCANNLGMVYHAQGKLGLAELLYQRALPIRKKALGNTHPAVTELMDNLASVLEQTNRLNRAEQVREDKKNSGVWHLFETRVPLRLNNAY